MKIFNIAAAIVLACGGCDIVQAQTSPPPIPLYYEGVFGAFVPGGFYDQTGTLVMEPAPAPFVATNQFTVPAGSSGSINAGAFAYYSPVSSGRAGGSVSYRTTDISSTNPPTIQASTPRLLPSNDAPFIIVTDAFGNATTNGAPLTYDSNGDPLDSSDTAYVRCYSIGYACADPTRGGTVVITDPNGNPVTSFQQYCDTISTANPDGTTNGTFVGCRTTFTGTVAEFQGSDIVLSPTMDANGQPIVFTCTQKTYAYGTHPTLTSCSWAGTLAVGTYAMVVNGTAASGRMVCDPTTGVCHPSAPGGSYYTPSVYVAPPPPPPPPPPCPDCGDLAARSAWRR